MVSVCKNTSPMDPLKYDPLLGMLRQFEYFRQDYVICVCIPAINVFLLTLKNPPLNCQPASFPRLTITTFVTFISFTSSFARVFPPCRSHIGDAFWDAWGMLASRRWAKVSSQSEPLQSTTTLPFRGRIFFPLQPQSPKWGKSWVSKTCEKTAPFGKKGR